MTAAAPRERAESAAVPPASFGSYPPEDVTFLLKDLGDVAIERGTEDREEAIQAGRHYAEMLPVEYRPDPAYVSMFTSALHRGAERLALAVGVVSELVLRERPDPVLVSLARAGTPVGILLRRWAAYRHGLDLPHYSISIVRGRGIDRNAVRYVLDRHDPARVQFVDGWTGKGAIARELTAAVRAERLPVDDRLAVLADPGQCAWLYGTRDDFLIPSACLNSTVSGLVSRTVLNDELIGPGDFHGAKYYRELSAEDRSRQFVDTVCAAFPAVRAQVDADWPVLAAGDRLPTWAGWRAVEAVAAEYGISDLNLVKPGVGETTRVLLRRVPWRVLVAPGRRAHVETHVEADLEAHVEADLEHVLHLAAARNVPVEEHDGLTYSCMGLIRPLSRPGRAA